jgi:hypothetical protein
MASKKAFIRVLLQNNALLRLATIKRSALCFKRWVSAVVGGHVSAFNAV